MEVPVFNENGLVSGQSATINNHVILESTIARPYVQAVDIDAQDKLARNHLAHPTLADPP